MIDILLIAPVRAYRDALAAVLEADPGCDLVAQAASGAEALIRVSQRQPAVALLDFGIDDVLPVLGALRRTAPTTRLIGIGVGNTRTQIEALICAAEGGASAFVDADQPLTDLVGAIHFVAEGKSFCSPRIAAVLLQALRRRPPRPPIDHLRVGSDEGDVLTARERVVAELAARGLTNRQIASQLVLGESTVKSHVHSILRKLGVARRDLITLDAVRLPAVASRSA